jgi:hypothetical protein
MDYQGQARLALVLNQNLETRARVILEYRKSKRKTLLEIRLLEQDQTEFFKLR